MMAGIVKDNLKARTGRAVDKKKRNAWQAASISVLRIIWKQKSNIAFEVVKLNVERTTV